MPVGAQPRLGFWHGNPRPLLAGESCGFAVFLGETLHPQAAPNFETPVPRCWYFS